MRLFSTKSQLTACQLPKSLCRPVYCLPSESFPSFRAPSAGSRSWRTHASRGRPVHGPGAASLFDWRTIHSLRRLPCVEREGIRTRIYQTTSWPGTVVTWYWMRRESWDGVERTRTRAVVEEPLLLARRLESGAEIVPQCGLQGLQGLTGLTGLHVTWESEA